VDECKPLLDGFTHAEAGAPGAAFDAPNFVLATNASKIFAMRTATFEESGRGLHSFPIQLNFRAFYGIGGARRGCVACVKGALGGV